MKPDTSEWNLSGNYDPIEAMDVDGAAWEFLRRNEFYQADYAKSIVQNPASDEPGTAPSLPDRVISSQWGLRFRSGPAPFLP